jgi:hypothetical protein
MQFGVSQLEELFVKSKSDADVLRQLENELQYRQVPRAVALLAKVRAVMRGGRGGVESVSFGVMKKPIHSLGTLNFKSARVG